MSAPKDGGAPPLSARSLVLLTMALPVATFMQVVDVTICNVAVPTISGNLGASYSQGTWVITSYSVANAIALPLTGRLAQRFGEVRLFLLSTTLFSLSSLFCGLSPNLNVLVFFRVIQGATGGPMLPLAQSLLMKNYPRDRQIMALAFFSMTVSVAPVFGPILGGWISDNCHWSYIFFINVPFGFVVAMVVRKVLSGRESGIVKVPMSAVAFGFLALGVGSLQVLLDKGRELDWFNSNFIRTLAVSCVVGLTLLIVWESRAEKPLIDLRLFLHRNFTVGLILMSLGMMLYLGTIVLLPLLLQSWYGYTATWAGLVSAPVGVAPVFLTPLIGRFGNKIDLRIVISVGFLVFSGCMYMRTRFNPSISVGFVVLPQFLQGFAIASFFVPIFGLAFVGLEPAKMAQAAGLFNCVRALFSGIGTSLATTLWDRREALHHTRLTSHIDGISPAFTDAVRNFESFGLSAEERTAILVRSLTQNGYIQSANEIYLACSVMFLIMILIVWAAGNTKRRDAPAEKGL
ncbi:MAG: DHA2 family efflux MFS transporter permease subunit [Deltaproteobacteria bacterium]|jgi:DHA2 family multidrug resistance protein|nr:DHA2 family efflux MFS transporter permease subunit [Deltaproteobacteria bacterium]